MCSCFLIEQTFILENRPVNENRSVNDDQHSHPFLYTVDDDTEAIKRAMEDGNRCKPFECAGVTTTPAIIYFPPG